MTLPVLDFQQLIKNSPLFAIDFVVLNELNQVLIGQRKNAPAQGFWFVPGGRVFKNESLEQAFVRLSQAELGVKVQRQQAQMLGLYDHFYEDSFFSDSISTHYINAAHYVKLHDFDLNLPLEQHQEYRWVSLDGLARDETIHNFSKVFLPDLQIVLDRM